MNVASRRAAGPYRARGGAGVGRALAGRLVPYVEPARDVVTRHVPGDERLENEAVVANLRLVLFWALRYQGRGVDVADLFQEGVLGLMRAVELFDARRGTRFSTYASWHIRASMQAVVLADKRWAGGDPRPVRSGSVVAADDGIDEVVVHKSVAAELRRAVAGLDELERFVVSLRFGLVGRGPLSLNDTARALRLGSRRVSELEKAGLRRLAEMLPGLDESAAHKPVDH